MRVLCLDLSTKMGWCILDGPNSLSFYGTIVEKVKGHYSDPEYPFNYLDMANAVAAHVKKMVDDFEPSVVVIEETNKGKDRYAQKQLEFIHFAVCSTLRAEGEHPVYLSTSEWRKHVGLDYDKSQRDANWGVHKQKKEKRKELFQELSQFFLPYLEEDLLQCTKQSQKNRLTKAYQGTIECIVKERAGKFRARNEDGKMIRKLNKKDLAVAMVNQKFGTKFKAKDNDICDAVLLGCGYYAKLGVSHE